jgi:hypothetical protein
MALETEVEEIKFYHEMGEIYKVRVLNIQEKAEGKTLGEEYSLKVLEIVRKNQFITEKARAKVGEEFSVWRAKNAGGYEGWSLLDN